MNEKIPLCVTIHALRFTKIETLLRHLLSFLERFFMRKDLFLLLFAVLFFTRCAKEHGEAPDTEAPLVNLTSPANGQTFGVNQNISVTATVSDNKKIEELHLEITNAATGAFFTHEHFAPDGPNYNLSRTFTLTAGTYKISVEADDPSGNHTEKNVTITVR